MAIAIGLLKMLLELHQTRKTGALDVAGPSARVRLFVDGGKLVFADEGPGVRSSTRGDAVVKQRIVRGLGWPNARLRFIESEGPLEIAERFEIVVEPLAVAALRLAEPEDLDELLSQARGRYAALHGVGATTEESARRRLQALRLPAAEEAFARTLDGSRTVAELIAEIDAGAAGSIDRRVVIAALLLTEALDLHGAPIASRPAGIATPPAAAVVAAAVAEQEAAASEPGEPGEPGEPEMAPLIAERAFKAGKKLARAHRLAEALVELRRAASLYPAVEHDLWAAWAEARTDPRGEESHRETLRQVAERAIAQDIERGFATYVLGHLARLRHDHARADELFESAQSMDAEVGAIDAWSVKLRLDPPSRREAGTRSDVVALAPLMTTPPPPVVEYGEREGEGDGEGDASADEYEEDAYEEDAYEKDEYAGDEYEKDEYAGDEEQFASAPALPLALAAPPSSDPAPTSDPPPASVPAEDESAHAEDESHAYDEGPHAGEEDVDAIHPAAIDEEDDTDNAGLPPSSRGLLIGGVLVAAVVVLFLIVRVAGAPPPKTESTSAVAPSAAPSHSAVAPPASASAAVAPAPAPTPNVIAVDASYASSDAGLPSLDPTKGILVLSRAADGHRVYVDGELAGSPPPPIAVGCGQRIVKIGAQGRAHAVVVPCGGSVTVPYP